MEMTDCTDNQARRFRFAPLLPVVVSLAALWVALVAFPAGARADGDPASDVLATQTLFLPQDAGVPVAEQGQLTALIGSAARSGYPVRVALVASRGDLGSVTELWRQPQTYAQFLGQELSLVYRGPLLVVMPDGFGAYEVGGGAAPNRSVLTDVHVSGGLGAAALAAIQRLAGASGHPLALPAPAVPRAGAHAGDTVSAIAFAVGAALVILAWTASLRAKPLGLRRRTAA